MKENVFDDMFDGIYNILDELSTDIAKEFKGIRPFQQKRIPERELLYNYRKLSEEEKMLYQQSIPPELWHAYEKQMQKLGVKYG